MIDAGLDWREAERQAFHEVKGGSGAAPPSPDPAIWHLPVTSWNAAPAAPPPTAPSRPAIVPAEVIPAGALTPPAPPPDPQARLHAWERRAMDRLAPGVAIALPAEYARSLFGERDPVIATDPGVMAPRQLLLDHIAAQAPAGRRPVVIDPSTLHPSTPRETYNKE